MLMQSMTQSDFLSVTIISTIIMGILFMSEINYYLTPTMSEELFVDTSRGSKLRINLDIIVPSISCDRKYRLCSIYTCRKKMNIFIFLQSYR